MVMAFQSKPDGTYLFLNNKSVDFPKTEGVGKIILEDVRIDLPGFDTSRKEGELLLVYMLDINDDFEDFSEQLEKDSLLFDPAKEHKDLSFAYRKFDFKLK